MSGSASGTKHSRSSARSKRHCSRTSPEPRSRGGERSLRAAWRDMRGMLGSIALLIVVALVVVRPWEQGGSEDGGPAAATARIVRVVDGDTVEIDLDGKRDDLRLIGIDTPETVKPGTPVQCYGPRASAFTHRLLDGRTVRI